MRSIARIAAPLQRQLTARPFKNFGHAREPEPLATKLYVSFLGLLLGGLFLFHKRLSDMLSGYKFIYEEDSPENDQPVK